MFGNIKYGTKKGFTTANVVKPYKFSFNIARGVFNYSSLTRLNLVDISFCSIACRRLKRFFCVI